MEEPSERKIIEMEELIMGVYDELKARGLIAQLTNEEKVRDLLNLSLIHIFHSGVGGNCR